MNFLKNRFLARVLLFLTVFGLTPFAAQGQLGDEAWEVKTKFTEDKGIYDRLEERSDAAGNLLSIAERYPALIEQAEVLRFECDEMEECLDDEDPSDLYEANEQLDPAFQAVYHALTAEDLSDNDRRAIEAYQNTFNGAQRMLESAAEEYNGEVRHFRIGTYSRFPARMFAKWFDIDAPEYFSSAGTDADHVTPEAPQAADFDVPDAPKVPDVPDAPELSSVMSGVDDVVDSVFDGVGDMVDGVTDGVGDIVDGVMDGVSDILDSVLD